MEKDVVYLVWQTDEWHSSDSYRLAYTGTSFEDIIEFMQEHKWITEDQAGQLESMNQTQGSHLGYEWEITEEYLNEPTDDFDSFKGDADEEQRLTDEENGWSEDEENEDEDEDDEEIIF